MSNNTTHTDSLKEYYIKIIGMYETALNMLTAINTSLSSHASEITVEIADSDDAKTTLRIPSFLYLESRLEQLENNFSNLFNMPQSGQAWLSGNNNLYKLEMLRANSAPIAPTFGDTSNLFASIKDNNILKDLVSPKTYIKLDLNNLSYNADSLFMRKIVINSKSLYDTLKGLELKSYDDYKYALYNFTAGKDYIEYDSVIKTPLRKDVFKSRFIIDDVLYSTSSEGKLEYKVMLDTLQYFNQEDSSIAFVLKSGDYLCLGNEAAVYKVKQVDKKSNSVIIEEHVGHIALQKHSENSAMIMSLYNNDYSSYEYAEVPLEENQYIAVFVGNIFNNVRSILSDGLLLDLSTIKMRDAFGNPILDSFGNEYNYLSYYNKFCTNIGDLILGITQTAYPQISNFTPLQLDMLQNSKDVKSTLAGTIAPESILRVVPINKHLTNDQHNEDIKNLHAQKNDINAQLQTLNGNINQVYNKLLTTDFTQETTVTQSALQNQLSSLYTERTIVEKQLNDVIDSISVKTTELTNVANIKYRIRGVADVSLVEEWVKSVDTRIEIVGMDLEYKYKSTTKDTSTVNVINNSTFTDWNKLHNIDKERFLEFDKSTSSYILKFVDYNTTDNIIKWNQIDIPITNGEDVVIRVRYKLNVGQPFSNMYTQWSDDVVVMFPAEFTEDQEMKSIVDTNINDTTVAGYRKMLIDEGYEEHIHNKVVTSDKLFFHQPENIYSGFNTPENNMISLKDKLNDIVNDVEKYKQFIESETNAKIEAYIEYDGTSVLLSPNTFNRINIFNTNHIVGTFIKKDMNLVIKNVGTTRVNLYSIFPGNTQISLLESDIDSYRERIVNYERVPLLVNGNLQKQCLGQWIYFRQNNPYTKSDVYLNSLKQRNNDNFYFLNKNDEDKKMKLEYVETPSEYMIQDNKQVLLGYRDRFANTTSSQDMISNINDALQKMYKIVKNGAASNFVGAIVREEALTGTQSDQTQDQIAKDLEKAMANIPKVIGASNYTKLGTNPFVYENTKYFTEGSTTDVSNKFLMRFEDIQTSKTDGKTRIFLDETTPIQSFIDNYSNDNSKINEFSNIDSFCGAFFYPDLMSKSQIMTEGGEHDSQFIDVGKSLSVPLVFEYFLTATHDKKHIKKSLCFDLKSSLVSNPLHYMVEITGNYDYSASGDIYSNFNQIELIDNVTGG